MIQGKKPGRTVIFGVIALAPRGVGLHNLPAEAWAPATENLAVPLHCHLHSP